VLGQYKVSAWDINVNTKLTDLPTASNLKFAVRMNDAGEFSYDLDLSDPIARATGQVIMGMGGIPFKTLVTANSDSTILYSGIAWQTTRQSSKSVLTIAGKALPSYFMSSVIANSYTTSIGPATLIKNVVTDAQAAGPGSNRGLVPVIVGSGQPPNVTPSYNKSQYTTVAQVIADMTAAVTPGTGGVDYYISDAFLNGVPQHKMMIVSPRCGRVQSVNSPSVNLAQATDWTWPTEATGSGNHIIVVGGGTGGAQPVATADATEPRGGLGQMPLLQEVLQYSHITNKTQLQTIANGSIQQFGKPIATPTVTIPTNYAPCALGEFQIGDDIRLWSGPSLWFPSGLSDWWRIAAYEVTVPDVGVPTVKLTLNRPPVF
jgi:hypothetical protein